MMRDKIANEQPSLRTTMASLTPKPIEPKVDLFSNGDAME
jgi:hypothetical protein